MREMMASLPHHRQPTTIARVDDTPVLSATVQSDDRLDREATKAVDTIISASSSSSSSSSMRSRGCDLYMEWLDSPYLSHQLQRIDRIHFMKTALEKYSCLSNKSTSDEQARSSIIAGDRIRSLGHLPSIIAMDVIPTLQNMCQIEHVYDNEYIEQLQLHHDPSLWMHCEASSSLSRRITRHSRPAREDARQYVRFPALKKLLHSSDDRLMMDLLTWKLM